MKSAWVTDTQKASVGSPPFSRHSASACSARSRVSTASVSACGSKRPLRRDRCEVHHVPHTVVPERAQLAPPDPLDQAALVHQVVAAQGEEVGPVEAVWRGRQPEEEAGLEVGEHRGGGSGGGLRTRPGSRSPARSEALAVVEDLDELEHRPAGLGPGGPAAAVDELGLQRGEPALGHGVVPALPGPGE